MKNLTPEQKTAIATFKKNTHLPGNGFHVLIVDLCKEYQLPFQKVRTAFKKSQTLIEDKICNDFQTPDENELTLEHWLSVIREQLSELSQENKPLMETLSNNKLYSQIVCATAQPIHNEDEQDQIINSLCDIYELEIAKSLRAMLHTSNLYWKVKSDLFEMTEEQRKYFSDYPEHMIATEHLLNLANKIKH